MTKFAILSDEELEKIITEATAKGFIQGQKNEEPKYYSPSELAEKFPFKESTWQTWIREGHLGRITRSGKMMATYLEAEQFLFERNSKEP